MSYAGRSAYIQLDPDLRARLEFVSLNIAGQYNALKLTILNRTEGAVDVNILRFGDLLGKKKVSNPNFSDGILPHLWDDYGKVDWYVYQPTQADYIKVWNKREKFADIQDFDSYLFILAKYTVINYISSKHIIPIDIDSLPDRYANESSPHDDVVAKDTQLLIDMVVESMPQQRQQIYRMSREQHLKNEEIAQRLGIQKKTVENHLNLALKEIKKALYLMILLPWHWV